MNSTVPGPGLRNQGAVRTLLRVLGPLVLLVGLALLVVALVDFFGAMGSIAEKSDPFMMSSDEPDRFWMAFVGLPLMFVGGAMTMHGYHGSMARYAAGETMPVVKDSAAYLSDGHGVAGVGRTVDDSPAGTSRSTTAGTVAGPYCRGCGTRNDPEARFCDSCGQSLA